MKGIKNYFIAEFQAERHFVCDWPRMNKNDNDLHLSYYLGRGCSFLLQEKLITPVAVFRFSVLTL